MSTQWVRKSTVYHQVTSINDGVVTTFCSKKIDGYGKIETTGIPEYMKCRNCLHKANYGRTRMAK